ncbi:MAG: hypothetical protein KY396_04295, partial [Actinobacteria bacterium]|nr:hypothetical protein [Actinomycetota bacterium]
MRDALVRFGGLAAMLGGAMWAAKGAAILAGRDQPAFVFEGAPLFFALALLGLHVLLRTRPERLERIGAAFAYLAAGLAAVTAIAALDAWNEDMPAPFNGTLAAATLFLVAALVALGIVARRAQVFGRPWSTIPLALGTLFVPLLLVGGLLSVADERLLEIPIVLLGLGWIVLGYAIASHA